MILKNATEHIQGYSRNMTSLVKIPPKIQFIKLSRSLLRYRNAPKTQIAFNASLMNIKL
jgi:hypothetical protein